MAALPNQDLRRNQILRILLEGEGLHGLKRSPPSPEARELALSSVWFVKEGLVRRYRVTRRGTVLIDLHGPGSVACSFSGGSAAETLMAEAKSHLIEIPFDEMTKIGRRHPEVLTTIVAGLARHQHALHSRIHAPPGGELSGWLSGLLEVLADEIGLPCRHGKPGWVDLPPLTHQDLADLSSRTRPHVSRRIQELLAEGRLERRSSRGLCFRPSVHDESQARIDASRLQA